MKTKFRSRGNLLRVGFFLLAALSLQPLFGKEPAAVTLEKAIMPDSGSHHAGLFSNVREHSKSGDQVVTGRTFILRAGESADGDVVVIRGHARIDGVVNGDLALIASDAEISGTVNGDMVAVASKTHFKEGALVNGDFSSVISTVERDENLHVNGSRVHLDFLPTGIGQWLSGTIFLLRPMSPDSFVSWFWALLLLGLCLAVGYFFPKPVAETGAILRGRAPASFLCGLAIIPAVAFLCFLLLITVIGAVAIPLVVAAVFVLALFGNAVVFQLIGQRVAPQMSTQKYPTLLWIGLGAIICWVVYCIPVIGFLAGSIVLLAGLGSFSLYLLERSRNRVPVAQLPAGKTAATKPAKGATPPSQLVPPVSLVRVTPSAPFWPRLGANVIDLVIILALLHFLLAFLPTHQVALPAWVLYRFAMYVWRSATIGEMALNLRVQRFDGTLLTGDYGTAMVRALGGLLSLLPLGLGFFWTLFDPARETWHDKITNTQVVSTRPTAPPPPGPQPPATPTQGPGAGPTEPPTPAPKPEPGPGEPPIGHRPVTGPSEPPPTEPKPEFRPVEPPPTEPKPEGSSAEPQSRHP